MERLWNFKHKRWDDPNETADYSEYIPQTMKNLLYYERLLNNGATELEAVIHILKLTGGIQWLSSESQ